MQVQRGIALGELIVSSRLLVMQSKRLMLGSAQRRLRSGGPELLRERVETLRGEADQAHDVYEQSVLAFAPSGSRQYLLVAYGKLVEVAETLSGELRRGVKGLPPAERFEAATEVEMLEGLIGQWRSAVRATISPTVA